MPSKSTVRPRWALIWRYNRVRDIKSRASLHIQRRQGVGDIINHRRLGAAVAEENHRPEAAAGAHADHQLVGAVSRLHRLHRKSVDRRIGGQIAALVATC
jgi:hypothetical protein